MGDCIVCGTSTDGPICDTHQEDVIFEFRGDHASQLTEGRFYRGVVDGYADFGVFVDLAPGVTGLLHRSKIDQRLESLDWEPGESVCVQVTNVRDNGDIDLGWSIRQTDREFRGTLIDEPEGDRLADGDEDDDDDHEAVDDDHDDAEPAASETEEPATEADMGAEESGRVETSPAADADSEGEGHSADTSGAVQVEAETEPETVGEEAETATQTAKASEDLGYERMPVGDLREYVGSDVRLEGEVASVRQTSGPTVFELRDETGVVDCAAFVEAGVRAYPDIEPGDIVRLDGEVRVRRDELQVETEALVALEDEEADAVEQRMEAALESEASPETFEPLIDDDAVTAIADEIETLATTIRRAVFESRPVVVRHAATTDGYVAGAAIERAVLPLIRDEHAGVDAEYHYFDRRPLEEGSYGMADATKDTTRMLDNRERHDEKLPLFVFAAAGSTADSLDGLELLDIYGAEMAVVDGVATAERVTELASAVAAAPDRTAGTLAANVAAATNADVRDDLGHLPAVTYWEDAPEAYATLASEAGFDDTATANLREAIALEAYYQSYEDKRELIIDLLFEGEVGLAEQVAEQFREKLDAALQTAEANIETREVGGATVSVLDMDAYTHRFDFPPKSLLLDELHRRHRAETPVVVGFGKDELFVRTTSDVDLESVAADAAEHAEAAGISATGLREGKLSFLSGRRDAAVEAVLEATTARL